MDLKDIKIFNKKKKDKNNSSNDLIDINNNNNNIGENKYMEQGIILFYLFLNIYHFFTSPSTRHQQTIRYHLHNRMLMMQEKLAPHFILQAYFLRQMELQMHIKHFLIIQNNIAIGTGVYNYLLELKL